MRAHRMLRAVPLAAAVAVLVAVAPPAASAQSLPATCSAFTDNPIQPQVTVIRAQYFSELRACVNDLRDIWSLGASSWSETLVAGQTVIRTVHVQELRTALNAVYAAAAQTAPSYTDTTLTAQTSVVRAAYINELRSFSAAAPLPQVSLAAPTIGPAPGSFVGEVAVTMAAAAGATIRYTTDGSAPTATSLAYNAPLTLTTTTTLRAVAFKPNVDPSPEASAAYTIVVATPTLSLSSGPYDPGTSVLVSSADAAATLRFTLTGADPGATDPVIASGTTMLVGGFTLKVRAFRAGASESAVAVGSYSLSAPLHAGVLAVGDSHTVLGTPDGLLYAWGSNGSSRLGDGTTTNRLTPTLIPLTGVAALAGGTEHTLAALADGSLWAWGNNGSGRLGDGTTTTRSRPVPITSLGFVTAVAAGAAHSLALTADGYVYAWGSGGSGQLGVGTLTSQSIPTLVSGLSDVIAIAAGANHSLAVTVDGRVYAWGSNASSQLGDGGTMSRSTPATVPGLSAAAQIAAGTGHSLALTQDGTLYVWGANGSGQLGLGDTTTRSLPTVLSGTTAVAVASGANHSFAVRADGVLMAWGANGSGQLGDTTSTNRLVPTAVAGPPTVATVGGGALHSVATATNGNVWTWGAGASGRLGDGTSTARPTPQSVLAAGGAWGTTPVPLLSLPGGTYNAEQVLTVSSTLPGTVVRYTTSTAVPTESDPTIEPSGEISIGENRTLTFRAWAPGLPPSKPLVATFVLEPAAPTMSPVSGSYPVPQTVTLSAAAGTTIRYTVDGQTPTASSPVYGEPLLVSDSIPLKARAFRTGWSASPTASGIYEIDVPRTNVAVTAPEGGSRVNVAGAQVTARVISTTTITAMNFYADGVLIGSVTTAPYQLTWAPSAPGSVLLTAAAVEASGRIVISPPVAVTVVPMPFITGVSPTAAVAGTMVTITGSGFGNALASSKVWIGTNAATVAEWSDTQIVAAVAPGSLTGNVQVRLTPDVSNTVPFTIATPTISAVTPEAAPIGASVTISGTDFGASQGAGQVWLGTAAGIVTSWSDSQIVATVAPGSRSGTAGIVQYGVASNSLWFTVSGMPEIWSVTPTTGSAGTVVSIEGTGFGASQGSGQVAVGPQTAAVSSWTDTAITMSVPANAASGVIKVRQNNVWSNGVSFRVPSTAQIVSVTPEQLSLLVGQERTLQALNATGEVVTGAAFASSDPSVVAISTTEPGVLIAIGPGSATITSGDASADVTVYAGSSLPEGTVIWSAPKTPVNVYEQVMAVPNANTVADVFTLSNDGSGTVRALTEEGSVAWTSVTPPVGQGQAITADFEGGVILHDTQSITRLAPTTGAPLRLFTATYDRARDWGIGRPVVHTDGTVFTIDYACKPENCSGSADGDEAAWIVAIDSTTGAEKFRIRLENSTGRDELADAAFCQPGSEDDILQFSYHAQPNDFDLMIAGDGFVYLPYRTTAWEGLSRRSAAQPWPDEAYGLFEQLRVHTGNSNFGAALVVLRALWTVMEFDFNAGHPLYVALQQGNRTQAINIENSMAPQFRRPCDSEGTTVTRLRLLKVAANGASADMVVKSWTGSYTRSYTPTATAPYIRLNETQTGPHDIHLQWHLITNGDDGVLMSWRSQIECRPDVQIDPTCAEAPEHHLTPVAGGVAGDLKWLQGNVGPVVSPQLQLEDGLFLASFNGNLNAFDASGRVQWSAPGGWPMFATADGGAVISHASGTYAYGPDGHVVAPVGSLTGMRSWRGLGYSNAAYGDGITRQIMPAIHPDLSSSYAALQSGNPSGNRTAISGAMARTADQDEEQLPQPHDLVHTNYNSIHMRTTETPDDFFDRYMVTYAGVKPETNDYAWVVSPTPVTAVCQIVTFRLANWWKRLDPIGQGDFSVAVTKADRTQHLLSVVTLKGHPVSGWRYWRAFPVAPDEVVIETGGIDSAGRTAKQMIGYYIFMKDQTGVWKRYMEHVARDQSQRVGASTVVGQIPSYTHIDGIWMYSPSYLESHITQRLPASCNQ